MLHQCYKRRFLPSYIAGEGSAEGFVEEAEPFSVGDALSGPAPSWVMMVLGETATGSVMVIMPACGDTAQVKPFTLMEGQV